MHSRLSLCIYSAATVLTQTLTEVLSSDRYSLKITSSGKELLHLIQESQEEIDCLMVVNDGELLPIFNHLYEQGILLPVIIINEGEKTENSSPTFYYHSAEIQIASTQLDQLSTLIDKAIAQFLHLGPSCAIAELLPSNHHPSKGDNQPNFLLLQQRRLAEKLKERLGYLGVYYKRNPQQFYRNLTREEKKQVIKQLKEEYREIALCYFVDDRQTNQLIDQFANHAFFTDISVSQVLEIHMELMDEFAQQLKLEGRSEEILLDYRLVIIDIIAHLCEMYRRSIPREDLPFDSTFNLE